jgi:predicted transcriptional regulator
VVNYNYNQMKTHKGMRPQDIVVLLKIAAKGETPWKMKDLAIELGISASEVSESLNRSAYAGLLSGKKNKLMPMALLEFLQYGLKYVYPQHPGALVRGMPTAHAAKPLINKISGDAPVVWPTAEGKIRGQALEPLYPSVPEACSRDSALYELCALADALRIGKVRERAIAVEELKNRLL